MSIPFTQYNKPYGETRKVTFELDEDIEAKAKSLIAKGYYFEMDVVHGLVSLTCGDEKNIISYAECDNNPSEIRGAIRDVVQTACAVLNREILSATLPRKYMPH